jgi:Family of unknown function (DUF6152)
MKRGCKQALGVLIVAAAAAASSPVQAHHSFAVYDTGKTVTLKGSVKDFQWSNPHCVIWVMIQPEGGGEAQEWSIETTSPGVLTRSGWTRNAVKPGDRVSVEFNPLRDGFHGGRLQSITLLDTGQKLQAASIVDSEKAGSK